MNEPFYFHGHGSFACRPLYSVVSVLWSDTKRVDSNLPRVVPTAWVEGSKKTRLVGRKMFPNCFVSFECTCNTESENSI